MLLIIHNLPHHVGYADIKSFVRAKCGLEDIIIDDLKPEGTLAKRVTVGVANDSDGALLIRNLNGAYMDGQMLYVEDSRQRTGSMQPMINPAPAQGFHSNPSILGTGSNMAPQMNFYAGTQNHIAQSLLRPGYHQNVQGSGIMARDQEWLTYNSGLGSHAFAHPGPQPNQNYQEPGPIRKCFQNDGHSRSLLGGSRFADDALPTTGSGSYGAPPDNSLAPMEWQDNVSHPVKRHADMSNDEPRRKVFAADDHARPFTSQGPRSFNNNQQSTSGFNDYNYGNESRSNRYQNVSNSFSNRNDARPNIADEPGYSNSNAIRSMDFTTDNFEGFHSNRFNKPNIDNNGNNVRGSNIYSKRSRDSSDYHDNEPNRSGARSSRGEESRYDNFRGPNSTNPNNNFRIDNRSANVNTYSIPRESHGKSKVVPPPKPQFDRKAKIPPLIAPSESEGSYRLKQKDYKKQLTQRQMATAHLFKETMQNICKEIPNKLDPILKEVKSSITYRIKKMYRFDMLVPVETIVKEYRAAHPSSTDFRFYNRSVFFAEKKQRDIEDGTRVAVSKTQIKAALRKSVKKLMKTPIIAPLNYTGGPVPPVNPIPPISRKQAKAAKRAQANSRSQTVAQAKSHGQPATQVKSEPTRQDPPVASQPANQAKGQPVAQAKGQPWISQKTLFKAQKKALADEYKTDYAKDLDPNLASALQEECEAMLQLIKEVCSKDQSDDAEKTLCQVFANDIALMITKSLHYSTTKRAQNIPTHLNVRVNSKGKIDMTLLGNFLKSYSVYAISKTKTPCMAIAKCKTFSGFDRLCALGHQELGGIHYDFNPLNAGGPPIKMSPSAKSDMRSNFINSKIDKNSDGWWLLGENDKPGYNKRVQDTVTDVQQTATNVQQTATDVHKTATVVQVTAKHVPQTAESVQGTAKHVPQTAESVQGAAKDVHQTAKSVQGTAKDVQQTETNVEEFAKELKTTNVKEISADKDVIVLSDDHPTELYDPSVPSDDWIKIDDDQEGDPEVDKDLNITADDNDDFAKDIDPDSVDDIDENDLEDY